MNKKVLCICSGILAASLMTAALIGPTGPFTSKVAISEGCEMVKQFGAECDASTHVITYKSVDSEANSVIIKENTNNADKATEVDAKVENELIDQQETVTEGNDVEESGEHDNKPEEVGDDSANNGCTTNVAEVKTPAKTDGETAQGEGGVVNQGNENVNDSESKTNSSDKSRGSVSLTYSDKVTVDLSEKRMTLMYQNPKRSQSDVILRVVMDNIVLAESGVMVPGTMVNVFDLQEDVLTKLQPGDYECNFVVSIFDPDTGEQSWVSARAVVNIVIQE